MTARMYAAANAANEDLTSSTVEKVATLGSKASRALETGRSARAEGLRRAAATPVGAAVGTQSVRIGRSLASLPLLSLPRVVIEQRRGVAVLTAHLRARPTDPVVAVQLAEALTEMKWDLAALLAARTVLTWYAPLISEAAKLVQAMDDGEMLAPDEVMFRRAYALALVRLRVSPEDGEALHVIARVFRARSAAEAGLPVGRAAVAVSSGESRGQAAFTLARLYAACGRDLDAKAAAQEAISAGCTLGHRVLADVETRDPVELSTTERIRARQEHLSAVLSADDVAYSGWRRPDASTLLRAIGEDQVDKARTSLDRLMRRDRTDDVPT